MFKEYHRKELWQSAMYWMLTLVMLANAVAVYRQSSHPILWLSLIGALWVHLILQHHRIRSNRDIRTEVAWSTFVLVILCNVFLTLALGGTR